MSGHKHPDTETLASLRTGLVRGFRGKRLAAHVARCGRCAAVSEELAAVSSFLASAPVPSLPLSFEHQITAALASEAAARQTTRDAAGETAHEAAKEATKDAARNSTDGRRRPTGQRRRPLGFRPAMAFVPAVVCLLLAGFGYLLSNAGQSSGPASFGPAAGAANVPSATTSPSGSSAFFAPAAAPQIRSSSAKAGKAVRTPGATAASGGLFVITSGTSYEAATLRSQVTQELDAMGANVTPTQSASATGTPSLNPASADNGGGFFSGPSLTSCVLHLTNNVTPSLVDEASYQGKPVFVIALPDRVWVVGRGCTASDPELVVSVVLSTS